MPQLLGKLRSALLLPLFEKRNTHLYSRAIFRNSRLGLDSFGLVSWPLQFQQEFPFSRTALAAYRRLQPVRRSGAFLGWCD
jgi:hypothetical protein